MAISDVITMQWENIELVFTGRIEISWSNHSIVG